MDLPLPPLAEGHLPSCRCAQLEQLDFDCQIRKPLNHLQMPDDQSRQQDGEDRYRYILNRMPEPVMIYDRQSLRYLAINEAAVKTYGYSEEEFLSMTLLDIRDPEERPKLLKFLEEMPFGFQRCGIWQHRKKDGQLFPVDISANDMTLDGKLCRIVVARDISEQLAAEAERRQAQEALIESESRLRFALDSGNMGIFDWDMVNDVAVWSDRQYVLFGYDEKPSPGPTRLHHFMERVHPDDRARITGSMQEAMEAGGNSSAEFRILRPDGSVKWVLSSGEYYYNESGQPVRLTGTTIDITERKNTEAELVLRDRAINAVQLGLMICDATSSELPIIYTSPGFETITGYSAQEAQGKNPRFLHGKDTSPEAMKQIRQAIDSKQSCTVEILNYKKSGEPFWNELTISPVRDQQGRLTHFVGIQCDVTVRRKFDEQLRHSQKMEAVGQLAGGIAHDFNNLLTVINGYSELLLETFPQDDRAYEPLKEIKRAAERAAELTSKLLTFGRRQMAKFEIANLNEIVVEAERMLRRMIGENIKLMTNLKPDIGFVRVDVGQIEQILVNLAINARDAMPNGGWLTIETDNVTVSTNYIDFHTDIRPGEYVCLTVTDNGCGMTTEVRDRIFEPFFTTKEVGQGTGLGLPTVFSIVQQCHGAIYVYSEPNIGTAFKIYLPLVEQSGGSKEQTATLAQAQQGTETVLLIEDEPGVRTFAQHILTRNGYKVMCAENGEAAVRLMESLPGPLDLVVTDVVMPGMSGPEAAEIIRQVHPNTNIIYMSGYTNDAVLRHGILSDKIHFLQKPFSPTALANKVREVLDGVDCRSN